MKAAFWFADYSDSLAKFRRSDRSQSAVPPPDLRGETLVPRPAGEDTGLGMDTPCTSISRRRQEDNEGAVVSSALMRRVGTETVLCLFKHERVNLASLSATASAFRVIQGIISAENVPNCSHETSSWWSGKCRYEKLTQQGWEKSAFIPIRRSCGFSLESGSSRAGVEHAAPVWSAPVLRVIDGRKVSSAARKSRGALFSAVQ